MPVYSWVYEHQNGYMFLYKNESKNLKFDGIYKFELKGMFIEGEVIGTSQWRVLLPPGE